MNKFELMNVVLTSTLKKEPKLLLIELILRANEEWECWPSVERLCQVVGIAHEKNFKGVEYYLPGLVTKEKKGRKNFYRINTPAVEGLSQASVTIKHTPALEGASTDTPSVEGLYTPSTADNTPAVADNTPSVEGANSTLDNTIDTTEDTTAPAAHSLADAPSSFSSNRLNKDDLRANLIGKNVPAFPIDTTTKDTPALEGVLTPEDKARAAVERQGADLTEEQIDECINKILNRAGYMNNIQPIDSRARYAVHDAVNGELVW